MHLVIRFDDDSWLQSHVATPRTEPMPAECDVLAAIRDRVAWWEAWSARCTYTGPWRDAVPAIAHRAHGHDVPPTGDRGRAHHFSARAARRRAELGLSL